MSIELHTPEALFVFGHRVWKERPELHAVHGSHESLSFWGWLMTTGWSQYAELRELLPTPPPELIQRVTGAATEDEFHDSGYADASIFFDAFRENGFDFARPTRVLDFACGCGRLLRAFSRFSDRLELHGADIDAEAIAWNRRHLGFARFDVVETAPPTRYPDGFFGGVYAYSVFSHLDEELHLHWLAELHRITSPGAMLVLTVQGPTCATRFQEGNAFGLTIPTAEEMRRDRARLDDEGFLYYPYPRDLLPDGMADAQGMTFLTEDYVRRKWLEGFDLADYRTAPTDWQDFVVLRQGVLVLLRRARACHGEHHKN
jgi:SAM-dependent methyltransferase